MTIGSEQVTPARERALAAVSVLSTQNTELGRIFEQIYNQLPSLQLGSVATGVSGVELIRCVNSLVPRLWFGFETSMCAIGCHHVEICAFLIMPFVLMTYLPFSSLLPSPLPFVPLSSPPLQALGGDCLPSFCGHVSPTVLTVHMLWGLLLQCNLCCCVS